MTNREAALKSCKDRLEHLENAPSHHCGKRQRQRAIELEKVKIEALRPITREQVAEVWKPCKVCNGKTTLYQHTNTTKLFMNTFGKATTLVTECNGCPPYADCCMKGISMNSAFRISYCPECGRPLTDKAVDMVMERLEALGYGKDD